MISRQQECRRKHADNWAVAWAMLSSNETDKPRQGVVAKRLNLFSNGTVGFIDWLDVVRSIARNCFFRFFSRSVVSSVYLHALGKSFGREDKRFEHEERGSEHQN